MDEELKESCCDKGPEPDGCNCVNQPDCGNNINVTTSTGLYYSDGSTDPLVGGGGGSFNVYASVPKPKIKDVVIKQMDHGFLVKIGCQTLCIESPKTLLKALKKYLKDPDGVEQQHNQGDFIDTLK